MSIIKIDYGEISGGKEFENLISGRNSIDIPNDFTEGILIATEYSNGNRVSNVDFTISGCTAEQIGDHFGVSNSVATYGKVFKITNAGSTINITASANNGYVFCGLIY